MWRAQLQTPEQTSGVDESGINNKREEIPKSLPAASVVNVC